MQLFLVHVLQVMVVLGTLFMHMVSTDYCRGSHRQRHKNARRYSEDKMRLFNTHPNVHNNTFNPLLPSSKSTFSQPLKENYISGEVRIWQRNQLSSE